MRQFLILFITACLTYGNEGNAYTGERDEAIYSSRPARGHCAVLAPTFTISPEGELKISDPPPEARGKPTSRLMTPHEVKRNGNLVEIVEPDKNVITAIQLSESGNRVLSVQVRNQAREENPSPYKTDILAFELKYRNGICYQKRVVEVKQEIPVLRYDTELCRDLMAFFVKHPKALECACGNPAEDKTLAEILAKHSAPIETSYYDRMYNRPTGEPQRYKFGSRHSFDGAYVALGELRGLQRVASDHLFAAVRQVKNCTYERPVRNALNDWRIWIDEPKKPSEEKLEEPKKTAE